MAMLNIQMVIKKAHFSLYPRSGVSLMLIIGLMIYHCLQSFRLHGLTLPDDT